MAVIFKPEFLILSALWIVPHVLWIYTVKAPRSTAIVVVCALLLSTAYLLKPATGDLPRYSIFITTGYLTDHPYSVSFDGVILDPMDKTGEAYRQAYGEMSGFAWLSQGLMKILPDGPLLPRLTLSGSHKYVTDAPLLALLVISVLVVVFAVKDLEVFRGDTKQVWRDVLYSMPLILGSVFVFVGSQNSLRQYLGSCFLLVAFSSFYNRRYVLAFILVIIATSMHRWMLVLSTVLFFFSIILKLNLNYSKWYVVRSLNYRIIICSMIFGAACVAIMKLAVMGLGREVLQPMWSGFYLPEIKAYMLDIGSEPGIERVGSLVKIGLLATVLFMSEIILGKVRATFSFDSSAFRLAVFFFIAPFVIYPEIFSRLVYLYFMAELIFIVCCCLSIEKRGRLAGIVVFFSYAFAPNVINILVGPEWLYALG